MKSSFTMISTPYLSEKVVDIKENDNKVVFKVSRDSNKIELKKAIESIFKVKVESINTINMKGKKKRQGRYEGKKSAWKKAIVSLKEGDSIEYFEGA